MALTSESYAICVVSPRFFSSFLPFLPLLGSLFARSLALPPADRPGGNQRLMTRAAESQRWAGWLAGSTHGKKASDSSRWIPSFGVINLFTAVASPRRAAEVPSTLV